MAVIARVVPDVTGVDKVFDYLVADALVHVVQVGDRVRIPLHRRNVAGWVVAIGDTSSQFSDVDEDRLLPVIKVLGRGPSLEIVQLAQWACHMWAGRLRAFFVASSPSTLVANLPGSRYTQLNSRKKFDADPQVVEVVRLKQTSLLRRGPTSGPRVLVLSAAQEGPTLVVIPTINRARLMAASLREHGLSVAVMPQDWATAAGGVDVVIGARSAIWASVPSLRSIIVIDEHDDALQEERSPSWHARDVAVRRAEQMGIACLLVSPVPSLRALHHTNGVVLGVGVEIENSQWPEIRIIDRRLDERWASSLLSSELIEQLRDHTRRIVCVLNVKGRAKLLACGNCRDLVRCDRCDAAMSMMGLGELCCPRCAHKRPAVCMGCGSGKLAVIKAGVSRLREELAAAAGRRVEDVVEVAASTAGKSDVGIDQTKMLFVGTEAALHRVRDVDMVVFLDIDQEISAPRYRASEISLTLVIHAARLVARSGIRGSVLVQTFLADHALLKGLSSHDFSEFTSDEMARRKLMSLPPFGALAHLSGKGIDSVADDLRSNIMLQVSATAQDSVLVKALNWNELADGLATVLTSSTTLKSVRIKTQVDPPRA